MSVRTAFFVSAQRTLLADLIDVAEVDASALLAATDLQLALTTTIAESVVRINLVQVVRPTERDLVILLAVAVSRVLRPHRPWSLASRNARVVIVRVREGSVFWHRLAGFVRCKDDPGGVIAAFGSFQKPVRIVWLLAAWTAAP